ncbi:MAG: acyl-CoA dehydrogenase family protein [Candidatus Coatesbacteria bacterium]|nr:MAG: acyl-CoA dehydrogenase family protein [Candidatus Coatesbacteria bacterium]
MDFELNDEQKAMKDATRRFADEVLAPAAQGIDEADETNLELVGQLAELGYLGLTIPEEYDGAGLDTVTYAMCMEELSRGCASTALVVSINLSLIADAILKFGTDEQRQKYLPGLATGEAIGCFVLTEPEAGTDAGAVQTTAVRDGDDYVINGTKCFITNASFAKTFLVFASTDPEAGSKGLSCFIADGGTDGLKVDKRFDKLGIRGADVREVHLEDCRVPAANMLGEEGKGLKIALTVLDGGRIGIAAQAVGIAQAALDEAVKYSAERKQFGRTINKFQATQFKLADMALAVDSARLLYLRAACLKDKGDRFSVESAMAKLAASRAANYVANQAVQIHGGYGYMKEYTVERLFRDARITEIYEGTSEVQKMVISSALLQD